MAVCKRVRLLEAGCCAVTELSYQLHIVVGCKQIQNSEGRKRTLGVSVRHPTVATQQTRLLPGGLVSFVSLSAVLRGLCADGQGRGSPIAGDGFFRGRS